jgi:hypothetical protein
MGALAKAIAALRTLRQGNDRQEEAMRLLKLLPVLAATVLPGVGTIANAEPLKIRNSYVVPVSNWAPLITAKKDLAKYWGKSYVMEDVRYQGTPPTSRARCSPPTRSVAASTSP